MFGVNTSRNRINLADEGNLDIEVNQGTNWNFSLDLFNEDLEVDTEGYKIFFTIFDSYNKIISKLNSSILLNTVTFSKTRQQNKDILNGNYRYELLYLDHDNNARKMLKGKFKVNFTLMESIDNIILNFTESVIKITTKINAIKKYILLFNSKLSIESITNIINKYIIEFKSTINIYSELKAIRKYVLDMMSSLTIRSNSKIINRYKLSLLSVLTAKSNLTTIEHYILDMTSRLTTNSNLTTIEHYIFNMTSSLTFSGSSVQINHFDIATTVPTLTITTTITIEP